METIAKHIAYLLHEHNCVIVPYFGGFLANYSGAKINTSTHTFTPPSKNIVFNINLKNNDGLLANYVSMTEGITYNEAMILLEKFVDEINIKLKAGEKVKLNTIGSFHFNSEKKLIFNPGNYNFLTDSFGLIEFYSPLIKYDNLGKRIEKSIKPEGAKIITLKSQSSSQFNIKKAIAVAASIPLLAGLIWVSLQNFDFKKYNYSNLNPFTNNKDTLTILVNKNNHLKNHSVVSTIVTSDSTVVDSVLNDNIAIESLVDTVKADSLYVATTTQQLNSNRYHIVTGCFLIEENANNFVAQLSSKQMQANIIGKNNADLFVVSSGDYNNYSEALNALREIQQNYPQAWLYKSN